MVIFMVKKSDARRLLFVLDNYSCDTYAIDLMAVALNYYKPQLIKDIEALVSYVKELENDSKESD